MNIKYDKYTDKYFLYLSDSNVVSLSFQEVENLKEQLQTICTDVYMEELAGLDLGDDCESGACKI